MHIRRQIELFLRRSGMSATRLGRLAAKDPRLVYDIRAGREVRAAMADKIRAVMARQDDGAIPS